MKSSIPQKFKILICGATFKENVSDIRNSQSIEVIKMLQRKKLKLDIYDPLIKKNTIEHNNKKIYLINKLPKKSVYDAILILTEWNEFKEVNWAEISKIMRKPSWIFDTRSIANLNEAKEIKKVQKQIAEMEAKLNESQQAIAEKEEATKLVESKLRVAEDRFERKEKLNELMAPLGKEKKEIMSDLLESVKTDKLQKMQ